MNRPSPPGGKHREPRRTHQCGGRSNPGQAITGHTRSFARLRFINGEFLRVLQHYCAGADHCCPDAGIKPAEAILPMTVANKPGHRGEHDGSRKTIAREMPGRSGVTVVTTLVCFLLARELLAREAAGALAPAFPAPSLGREHSRQNSRTCGEIAKLCQRHCERKRSNPSSFAAAWIASLRSQ